MSAEKFVLDTNFIIEYLKGVPAPTRFLAAKDKPELFVSDITRIELLSFPPLDDVEKNRINAFLEHTEILSITQTIGDIAISFRKDTRKKLPDSIIAATAILLGVPLVTSDKELLAVSFQGLSTNSSMIIERSRGGILSPELPIPSTSKAFLTAV